MCWEGDLHTASPSPPAGPPNFATTPPAAGHATHGIAAPPPPGQGWQTTRLDPLPAVGERLETAPHCASWVTGEGLPPVFMIDLEPDLSCLSTHETGKRAPRLRTRSSAQPSSFLATPPALTTPRGHCAPTVSRPGMSSPGKALRPVTKVCAPGTVAPPPGRSYGTGAPSGLGTWRVICEGCGC